MAVRSLAGIDPATSPAAARSGSDRTGRLVVVSSQMPGQECETPSGAANALVSALAEAAGIWIGAAAGEARAPVARNGADESCLPVTVALTEEQHAACAAMTERALHPVLHSRPDLAQFDNECYAAYRRVGVRFADTVARYAGTGDRILVHNHHLIPVARELRRQGMSGPIGFFLQTPFPDARTFATLPWARELAGDLACYDLVGFQTETCRDNFQAFGEDHCGGRALAGRFALAGGNAALGAFPAGIDAARAREEACSPAVDEIVARIRQRLQGQTGIVGLEKLDRTGGILESFKALEALLEQAPEFAQRICFLQVTTGSPGPDLDATEGELRAMSNCINWCYGSKAWQPIHFARRNVTRAQTLALLRACRVGLLARPRAGMGLAAKEYVAAQDAADPGVLVLSRHAGAAAELDEALLVDPHDQNSIAAGLRGAADMPRRERERRWAAMMSKIERNDAHRWRQGLLASVVAAHDAAPRHGFTARRRAV